jgi:transposase
MRAKERLPGNTIPLNSKWNWSGSEEEGSIAALARKHDVNDNLLQMDKAVSAGGRSVGPEKLIAASALILVQLQAGSFSNLRTTIRSPPATCHIKCRGGEITHSSSAELMSTVLRELMREPV